MVLARIKLGVVWKIGWLTLGVLPVGHLTRSRDRVGTAGVAREVTPVEITLAAERPIRAGLRVMGR